jgi:hypothetical protein
MKVEREEAYVTTGLQKPSRAFGVRRLRTLLFQYHVKGIVLKIVNIWGSVSYQDPSKFTTLAHSNAMSLLCL